MNTYQTFLDGLGLGVFLGFLAFYLFYRFKLTRTQKPKNDIDVLVDDIRRYYHHVAERKRRNFD
jgi:hypothetical protein